MNLLPMRLAAPDDTFGDPELDTLPIGRDRRLGRAAIVVGATLLSDDRSRAGDLPGADSADPFREQIRQQLRREHLSPVRSQEREYASRRDQMT